MAQSPQFDLRRFVAPEFIFGEGARHQVGRFARNFFAKKVLIVSDPGVRDAGWVADVETSLHDMDIETVVFTDILPNPRSAQVMRGADIYRENGCDVIVTVGGGSPIDCAKAIGIVHSNQRHVRDFEGINNVELPAPPIICIPTTSGTSADISQFAIINDEDRLLKFAIISKTVVPDVALIDPETTQTMPAYLTACTGMDALVHAVEAYVSTASSPVVDLHALEAVRLIAANLETAVKSPDDTGARGKMALASLHAGLAFSNASLGAVHAMAHSLGGLKDLAHGECNSLLIDHVIAFNVRDATRRYAEIADAMGMNLARESQDALLREIRAYLGHLKNEIGITRTLGDIGVRRQEIGSLAGNAVNDPCMVTNPRVPTVRDVEAVYEEAL